MTFEHAHVYLCVSGWLRRFAISLLVNAPFTRKPALKYVLCSAKRKVQQKQTLAVIEAALTTAEVAMEISLVAAKKYQFRAA